MGKPRLPGRYRRPGLTATRAEPRCTTTAPGRRSAPVTVGYMHVLKLHHLVDDKMHARSTGPVQPGHAAAAGRQGAVRRPALRRDGSLGAGAYGAQLRAPGDAHRQVRRRERPHQGLREHRPGRARPSRAGMPSRSTCWSRKSVRWHRHRARAQLKPPTVSTSHEGLLDLFKQFTPDEHFDAIEDRPGVAEKIRSWSFGEVKKPRPSTTAPSSRSGRPVLRQDLRADQDYECLCGKVQAPEAPRRHLREVRRRGDADQGAPRAHGHIDLAAGARTSGS